MSIENAQRFESHKNSDTLRPSNDSHASSDNFHSSLSAIKQMEANTSDLTAFGFPKADLMMASYTSGGDTIPGAHKDGKIQVDNEETIRNADGSVTTNRTGDLNDGTFWDTTYASSETVDKDGRVTETSNYSEPVTMKIGQPGVDVTATSVTIEKDPKTGFEKVTFSPRQAGNGITSPAGGYDTVILNRNGEVVAVPSANDPNAQAAADLIFRTGQ